MRDRIRHGAYETAAAFVLGTAAALSIDAVFNVGLTAVQAALIGGGTAALEVVEEVAKDVRDHFRDQRQSRDVKLR